MYPIYIFEDGVKLPESGTYYIVAANGIWLRKDTGLIQATVKVDRISALAELTPKASLSLPKLPAEIVVRSLLFFRAVQKKHHSEADVLLHYRASDQSYTLTCPQQTVSGASVNYDPSERVPEYLYVGTIHSHNDFQAFHSGVDIGDEKHQDGLHLTIGHVNQPYFTLACSVVINNNRFTLDPQDCIDGVVKVDWQPTTWSAAKSKRKVIRPEKRPLFDQAFDYVVDNGLDLLLGPVADFGRSTFQSKKEQFWNIDLGDGQDYRHVSFPKSWLDKVSKPVYTALPPLYQVLGETPSTWPKPQPPPEPVAEKAPSDDLFAAAAGGNNED